MLRVIRCLPTTASMTRHAVSTLHDDVAREDAAVVSPCSGCETGRPCQPFALRSATGFHAPAVLRSQRPSTARSATAPTMTGRRVECACIWPARATGTCGPFATPATRPRPTPTGHYPPRASPFHGGQRLKSVEDALTGKQRSIVSAGRCTAGDSTICR